MHCSGCGLIIGKEAPPDQCRCPRCARILRLLAFEVADGFERHRFVPVEGARKRFAALYVSEAMLRFELQARTRRAALWEPLRFELEEERLKAFAKSMGWVLSGVYRDPGPRAPESERPFARIALDLREGLANTVLVTDFERVTRKDLHRLWDLAHEREAELVSIAPHRADENLVHDNVDYDSVPESWADNRELERLWREPASRALEELFAAAGWHWTYYAADVLARALGLDAVRAWRKTDPACNAQHWKEVLTYFAIARARRTGALDRLAPPRLLTCALCRRRFLDAALPLRLMELTAGRSSYCRTCLGRAFFFHHDAGASAYVGPGAIDSLEASERGVAFFRELPRERFHAFLELLHGRLAEVEERGAPEAPSNVWLGALEELKLLGGYGGVVRSDSFFKATDGHLCASLGAALLDNWLHARGLAHRLDARYPRDAELDPQSLMRADFVAREVLVEFLGLRGRDEFRKTVDTRLEVARRAGLPVVGVYAEDLLVAEVLERKAEPLLAPALDAATGKRASG